MQVSDMRPESCHDPNPVVVYHFTDPVASVHRILTIIIRMTKHFGKSIRWIFRWAVAITGVVWVVSNIHLRDRISVLDENQLPQDVVMLEGDEYASEFTYLDPRTELPVRVGRDRVVNGPDKKTIILSDGTSVTLLGMRLKGDIDRNPTVQDLLIRDPLTGRGRFISQQETRGYQLDVPQPRVEVGAINLIRRADPGLLLTAIGVMPVTFIFTTLRWHRLLKALDIDLTLRRAFVLNMVGSFYNSFMLGSTGGDVLKAYYAAKQVPNRRTAAVMSVIVDRVIGLLALIILGGSMAGIHYALSTDRSDTVSRLCFQVAIVSVILLGCVLGCLVIIYFRGFRQFLGMDYLIARFPMQTRVKKVVDVLRVYREKPGLILLMLVMTFPVHITVVVSAMLAGMAFDLPISEPYYFIVVPVVVLVGAIPISPQGVGVMEAFAFYLTRSEGATVNQALALTMSIRLTAMVWNLAGGLFVLRGGYHTPSEKEQAELENASISEAMIGDSSAIR